MTKRILITIQAVFLLGISQSLKADGGTASAQFLKLGAGARAAAMGDAFSSIADDVTATYWNPAGLNQIKGAEVSLMHNDGLVETDYQFAAAALPLKNNALGLFIQRQDFGDIDRYTAADARQGSFDAGSMAVGLTWSQYLRENFSVGANAKVIEESIDNESASGFAIDLGLLYKARRFNASLVIQHLGPKIKFVTKDEDLPQTLRLGLSTKIFREKLVMAIEAALPKDNDTGYQVGLEYRLIRLLTLRAGYKTTPGNKIDVDGVTNVTGGLGFNLGRFSLDYSITPFGDLDTAHQVSLLFRK